MTENNTLRLTIAVLIFILLVTLASLLSAMLTPPAKSPALQQTSQVSYTQKALEQAKPAVDALASTQAKYEAAPTQKIDPQPVAQSTPCYLNSPLPGECEDLAANIQQSTQPQAQPQAQAQAQTFPPCAQVIADPTDGNCEAYTKAMQNGDNNAPTAAEISQRNADAQNMWEFHMSEAEFHAEQIDCSEEAKLMAEDMSCVPATFYN